MRIAVISLAVILACLLAVEAKRPFVSAKQGDPVEPGAPGGEKAVKGQYKQGSKEKYASVRAGDKPPKVEKRSADDDDDDDGDGEDDEDNESFNVEVEDRKRRNAAEGGKKRKGGEKGKKSKGSGRKSGGSGKDGASEGKKSDGNSLGELAQKLAGPAKKRDGRDVTNVDAAVSDDDRFKRDAEEEGQSKGKGKSKRKGKGASESDSAGEGKRKGKGKGKGKEKGKKKGGKNAAGGEGSDDTSAA